MQHLPFNIYFPAPKTKPAQTALPSNSSTYYNMIVRLVVFCAFFLGASPLSAQLERTMYQLFESDSVRNVSLDIFGAYELLEWAGNQIMVETTVQISHASPAIMDHLIKDGRYELVFDSLSLYDRMLHTRVKDRKRIKTPAGECTELVRTKIFIPNYLLWADDQKRLYRK